MKIQTTIIYLVLTCLLITSFTPLAGQVKVATDANLGTPSHPSAILEVYSTDKGMLPPRLTTTQRNGIASPAEGLLIYNTTQDCLNEYMSGIWKTYCDLRFNIACNCVEYLKDNGLPAQTWIPIATEDWRVLGNTGTNPNTNFVGTIDNQALSIRTNNVQRWRFEQNGTISFTNTGNSVFIGPSSGTNDDLTDNRNTFVGALSGNQNTTGRWNTAFGYNALNSNINGLSNTSLGASTMLDNTSGNFNVAVGIGALGDNTTGSRNVAIGASALNESITGGDNVAIGAFSLGNLTSGVDNIAIGVSAVAANGNNGGLPAAFNYVIGIGNWTYTDKTAGDHSVAMGVRSCGLESIGHHNTGVGGYSNYANRTGTYNSAFGYSAGPTTGALTNTAALGYNAKANASNKVRLGSTTVTVVEGQVAYSNPSDGRFKSNIKENVPGLDFVMGLRPVTYQFDTKMFDEFLHKETPDSIKAEVIDGLDYTESQQITHTGFVAQEIETLVNELNYDFDGLNVPKNESDNYSVSYSTFVVPMVKAMQEQQAMIEALQKQVDALEKLVREK